MGRVAVAACNGGGYDMRGTVIGNWIAGTFRNELLRLTRYFYGLTFHDPNYNPGKAVIGRDCNDCTLTKGDIGSKGRTVEEAEANGNSFGLERLQAVYKASSKTPTRKHTVPRIDGACGESSVLRILNAIGLSLRKVHATSKLDVYVIEKIN